MNKRLRGKLLNKFETRSIFFFYFSNEKRRQFLCVLDEMNGKLFFLAVSKKYRRKLLKSSTIMCFSRKRKTCINISEHNLFLRQNQAVKCRGAVSHPKNDSKKIKYTFYGFSANLSCRERDSCLLKRSNGQVGSVHMIVMG